MADDTRKVRVEEQLKVKIGGFNFQMHLIDVFCVMALAVIVMVISKAFHRSFDIVRFQSAINKSNVRGDASKIWMMKIGPQLTHKMRKKKSVARSVSARSSCGGRQSLNAHTSSIVVLCFLYLFIYFHLVGIILLIFVTFRSDGDDGDDIDD